jgi:hypothetical protein
MVGLSITASINGHAGNFRVRRAVPYGMKVSMWIVCFSLLTLIASAADVNGKWVAQMPGRGGQGRGGQGRGPGGGGPGGGGPGGGGQTREVTFTFKADGEKLTGNMSGPMGEREISDGKISGDDISFKMVMQFGENKMTMNYAGKVSGDEIKFTRTMEGREMKTEFTAKRAGS